MRAFPRLLAAAIALSIALAGGVAADPTFEPDTERFWILLDGCGDANYRYLSTLDGQPTSEGGCGTFWFTNDIWELGLTADEPIVWTYPAEDGTPFILDASRRVSGVVYADNWAWVGVGSAELTVTLTGASGGQLQALGTTTVAYDLEPLPDLPGQRIEFSFDLPAELDGAGFTSLALDLSIKGINSWHGYISHDYTSYIDVPTLVEAE